MSSRNIAKKSKSITTIDKKEKMAGKFREGAINNEAYEEDGESDRMPTEIKAGGQPSSVQSRVYVVSLTPKTSVDEGQYADGVAITALNGKYGTLFA